MWFAISDGVNVYYKRFYIEHGFKDLKGRFNLHRAMIRSTRILERLIALIFIAYILTLALSRILCKVLMQPYSKPPFLETLV